ncbi:hypothetical protein ACVXZ4_09375 [Lacisediminihabitans sp. FW035]
MRTSPSTLRSMIALSVFAALLGALLLVPLSAAAATVGPGYQQPGKPLNHLGGYLTTGGRIAYCIDAGLPSALGRETTDGGIVGSVAGLGAIEMLRLNTVLHRYGDTADPNTAAAVAMAVWSIAGAAAYQAEGGDAHVLVRAPADQRMAIQALADRMRAEAAAVDATPPSAALSISIDAGDDFGGIVSLDATPGVSGTVVLTNAVFADTGTSALAAVSAGARLVVTAVPPRGSTGYRISASSSDLAAPRAPEAAAQVFSTSGAQTLVASAGSVTPVLSASASDTRDRLLPSLSTAAQSSATVGGTVIDTATLADVPSSGVQVRWSGYLQPVGPRVPLCTDATLAFESTRSTTISTDGVFASELFPVTDRFVGTVFWIATVSWNGAIVTEGGCGDSAETTEITASQPPVHLPVVSG